jgi:hypothetical protein
MPETYSVDDLRAPRLSPTQRQMLEFTEGLTVDFDIDTIIDEAVQTSGVTNFDGEGFDEDFRKRLNVHFDAIEADDMTTLSRMTLRERSVRLLKQRVLFTDLMRRYPEIDDIEIEKPFIVIGMPRSGTTHFVNLIAADERRRALPYWESREPFPMPGEAPGPNGIDPRYARAAAEHGFVREFMPIAQAIHDRSPEAIEEEIELDLDFSNYILEWYARVPSWRDHYLQLDQTKHYGYMKRVLKALTFLRGPRTWVLKAPQHCEQIPALLETFPDATFAFTHRDPVAVIQSTITLMAYGDRIRRHSVDTEWVADYWVDRVERLLGACVRDRDLIPADRSIDISFHHLNGNEIPFLESLYERGNVEMSQQARTSFESFLNGNPRGKHGRVAYDLEGQFNRSAAEIRSRFDFYFDRFDVQPEAIGREAVRTA